MYTMNTRTSNTSTYIYIYIYIYIYTLNPVERNHRDDPASHKTSPLTSTKYSLKNIKTQRDCTLGVFMTDRDT